MELAIIYSRAICGIHAPEVIVEVHLSRGLPGISIVGLPETSVKESKDRVRSAILNNHFEFPLKRITINLAPADLPKDSGRYDLAIAIGILAASGQIPAEEISHYEFVGELALTGALRPVSGALPIASATKLQQRKLILPADNATEAAMINGIDVIPASHLLEVCGELRQPGTLSLEQTSSETVTNRYIPDMNDIHGHAMAKRALEICASGGHNLLLIGPPGSGKTMLAERLTGILPTMTEAEAMETAAIYSVSHSGFALEDWKRRPVRAPHHSASAAAITGGGSHPRPGEISLAHNGVLFLDEIAEFSRHVLEVLREPMESGKIVISRAASQVTFPAAFQLIAAMNPCPCGYAGEQNNRCICSYDQIQRYRSRISGPLLDRIDLHIEVPSISMELLQKFTVRNAENSADIRQRVIQAHAIQYQRQGSTNALLNNVLVEKYCKPDSVGHTHLLRITEKFALSARSIYRVLRIARTIADMEHSARIDSQHISEALSYRHLDRQSVSGIP